MISADNKAKIIKMWDDGLSGTHISEQVGTTRNAVIGFIHRLRNSGHVFYRDEKKVKKERVVEARKTRKPINPNVTFTSPELVVLPLPDMPTRDGGIDLMELKRLSCRFIVSPENDPVKYCGDLIDRSAYCKHHYRICYYPSRKSLREELKGVGV